jgi:hypothetical protein
MCARRRRIASAVGAEYTLWLCLAERSDEDSRRCARRSLRRGRPGSRIGHAAAPANSQRALYEEGRLDVLQAPKDHRVTIAEVQSAQRSGRLPNLAVDFVLGRGIWDAASAWLEGSDRSAGTRQPYANSIKALHHSGVLDDSATLRDLQGVDWFQLRRTWKGGAADWNHLRRAMSRLLTVSLGDVFHPFRRKVLNSFPRAQEPHGRVPDLSPSVFWQIVRECLRMCSQPWSR